MRGRARRDFYAQILPEEKVVLTEEERNQLQEWHALFDLLENPSKIEKYTGLPQGTIHVHSHMACLPRRGAYVPLAFIEVPLYCEIRDNLAAITASGYWVRGDNNQMDEALEEDAECRFKRIVVLKRVANDSILAIIKHLELMDSLPLGVARYKIRQSFQLASATSYADPGSLTVGLIRAILQAVLQMSNQSVAGLKMSYTILRDMLLSWHGDIRSFTSWSYSNRPNIKDVRSFSELVRKITFRLWQEDPCYLYREPLYRLHLETRQLNDSGHAAAMFHDMYRLDRFKQLSFLLLSKAPLEIAEMIAMHEMDCPRLWHKGFEFLQSDGILQRAGHCAGCSDGKFRDNSLRSTGAPWPPDYTSRQLTCPHYQDEKALFGSGPEYCSRLRGMFHQHYLWRESYFAQANCRLPLDECKGHYDNLEDWYWFDAVSSRLHVNTRDVMPTPEPTKIPDNVALAGIDDV